MGLAYEIVINSSPCISYLMEENTATMQTLVIAHAAFGHNHFFKNNYLFKQWTDADGILDYLDFAKSYVAQCEERHGRLAVERTLDAAHALMSHGIDRYPGKKKHDLRVEEKRAGERRLHEESAFNDLWRTVPGGQVKSEALLNVERRRKLLGLPQENLLYFLEKTAPRLQPWQRELLRIVRHIAQYFYPQSQTKVMNEGTATYVHYRIMNRLHEQGRISDGNFLEFLQSHTNVVFQPDFDDPRFSGFNPYALGFAMMQDIERIVSNPDDEDREWFPDIAGNGRRDGGAARYLGQLSRRKLHQPVSQPAADAAPANVPSARRSGGSRRHQGRCDSRRARLSPRSARTGAAIRRRLHRSQHRSGRRRSRRRPPPDVAPCRCKRRPA